MMEQFQGASVEAAAGRELVFPGALVELEVGKGRLILDERRWTTINEKIVGLRVRRQDSPHLRPKIGPPDKVAPQSAPVPGWTADSVR